MDVKKVTKRKVVNEVAYATDPKVRKKENIESFNKTSIIKKYKELEEKYNTSVTQLSILNDENVLLTMKVEELKSLQANIDSKSVSESNTQTEALYDEVEYTCKNCIYEANCPEELQWHMKSLHGIGDPYYEFNFSCRICCKHFDVKDDLMYHIKAKHERNMPACKFYQKGECHFSDDKCWFIHKKKDQTLESFKCGYCGKYSVQNTVLWNIEEKNIAIK